ncbi:AraC family transcriptional regulator [Sphingobacteriaceae bacterium]|nr:AraC family transcriptional regulator [Sphingobacteriaceae bacterium]
MKANDLQKFLELGKKLGVEYSSGIREQVTKLGFINLQVYDYLPDMAMMIRSLVSKEDFLFQRKISRNFEPSLLISFNNIFDDELIPDENSGHTLIEEIPHVQIRTLNLYDEIKFEKNLHKKQIVILVTLKHLREQLKDDKHFFELFEEDTVFWMEEIMSEDIIRVANELTRTKDAKLENFFFKLKTLELIYFLFRDLKKRKDIKQKDLTAKEVLLIYKVRDVLTKRLDTPVPVSKLVKLAGMNELKLRKLFTQVFGMGIYDYYQHIRMKEAARLLKEDNLSVSEVGYKLGFSNLSHFGRVFEQHIGVKPKKWSML